jgi:hypothetical protein
VVVVVAVVAVVAVVVAVSLPAELSVRAARSLVVLPWLLMPVARVLPSRPLMAQHSLARQQEAPWPLEVETP